ncbi:MAG TPA: N-acetyltransferase [Actinomycetota bacterium]|nr:N-acetyltransferase [Actinomycetota bacterium]
MRLERPDDRAAALDVERVAFGSEAEVDIVRAVRDEDGSFALVAEEEGRIIGHVQMSRAWAGSTAILALGPIGVLPERRRQGAGRALIESAATEARSRGEVAVILLGDPALYPRFGFEPATRYGLRNPFAGQQADGFVIAEEDMMILPLDDGVHQLEGPVRWHPSFG